MITKLQKIISEALVLSIANFKEEFTKTFYDSWQKNIILYISNFLISFLILYLHRPDSLNHPQLWAEDGTIFLRDEWILGFPYTIPLLYSGYIHLVPRFIAFLSNLFPYEFIPFVFNFSAIFLAAVSVSFFSLRNFRYIVKSDLLRTITVALICLTPVGHESLNTATNVHFYFTFGVFLFAIMGGKLSPWAYFGIFIYVCIGTLTAPLSIFYAPLFLIRYFIFKSDRFRWVYAFLFILNMSYGVLMFFYGSSDSLTRIDWEFFINITNVEKLFRVSFAIYFIDFDSWKFLDYFKFFWVFELIFLFFYIRNFSKKGIQNTILIGTYLIAIFVPILLRGGLSLSEEQASYVTLFNISKDSLYLSNVVFLLNIRYGLVPFMIFCILPFSVILNDKNKKLNLVLGILILGAYAFIIKDSFFIKPYHDFEWETFSEQVKNKKNVSIPINPTWWQKIEVKENEWKKE
ncbi:hypothetical protein P3G55_16265 [Leptospira sp. 96542]|nr:hypothetical protein [Leptospira sp. 96542]